MNPKLQAAIDAARERTKQLMEEQSKVAGLPASVTLNKPEEIVTHPVLTMIAQDNKAFDPYYIEGVGKLNKEQSEAVLRFGINGESGCLIGPAGTGKTTTMKAIIRAAIMSGRISVLPKDATHKYLKTGLPGIFGGSFTRIATRNLRDNSPDDIKANIHTIHRLLEFEPDYKEVVDRETGKMKNIRIFVPTRTPLRPLAKELLMFNMDEASMVGVTLHELVRAAANPKAQFLYIGDIAQLPPVMDDAILGYKLLELPTVELTEVYRHAGVIVNLANHIRVGNTIPPALKVLPYSGDLRKLPRKIVEESIEEWNREEDGSKVTIHLWKTRLEGEVGQLRALQNLSNFFKKEEAEGRYLPNEHMILIPYNKSVGTIELNRFIAENLGKKRGADVYEVIAGFNKHYLAVGDKVFYDREEAVITKIVKNELYAGKVPQLHSPHLDRWGHNAVGQAKSLDADEFDSISNLLNITLDDDEEERKNQASHVVFVKKLAYDEDDKEEEAREFQCKTAADINGLLFGYALTIHKSQGSQWPKVYCIFHNSHNRNLQRELLYTAITRAQKELYVICEPETFIQGVTSQHIVGNSLKEKAEYFKGKVANDKRKQQLFEDK